MPDLQYLNMRLEVGGDALDEVVNGDLVVLDHADDLQLGNACKSIVRLSWTSTEYLIKI